MRGNLKNHISLLSSNNLKEICRPLFDFLGVDYFAFHRVYNDGTVIRLSTYPEWTEHYISQNYFTKVRVDQYPSIQNKVEYHLWSHYTKYDPEAIPVMQDSYTGFGLHHGFSMIKSFETYADQYILAATKEVNNIDDYVYLVMIEPIEKFMPYFLEQSQVLIKSAEETKFL